MIYGGSSNALSFQDLDEAAEDSSRRRKKNKLSFDERKLVDLDIVSNGASMTTTRRLTCEDLSIQRQLRRFD